MIQKTATMLKTARILICIDFPDLYDFIKNTTATRRAMTSSIHPINGMKSGIISIGQIAYISARIRMITARSFDHILPF
jgi:hypothetical protein